LLSTEPLPHDLSPLPVRGSCFGFEVRSDLTFGSLRRGAGDPIRVFATAEKPRRGENVVHEWRQQDFFAQLFLDGDRYTFAVEGLGSVLIDPVERTLWTYGIDDSVVREEIVCGVPMAVCVVHRGDIALHGAAVEIEGKAVVLAGPGTYGKSTLAAALANEGHRLLAEDLVCVRPGSVPQVLPGPAAIRLRNDVVGRVSVATAESAVSGAHRTRLVFAEEERGDSSPVPLGAILFLRNDDSAPTSKLLAPSTAMPDLWALSLRLTPEDDARCFRALVDSVGTVPIFDLHRRLHFEELPGTVDYITTLI
jgi:hypothetical protein